MTTTGEGIFTPGLGLVVYVETDKDGEVPGGTEYIGTTSTGSVANADGTSTASAVGATVTVKQGVGNADGISTATAVSASTNQANADGTSTATAIGQVPRQAVGAANGQATANGTDAAAHPVTGNANGQASVSAVSIRGGYGAAALMVGV